MGLFLGKDAGDETVRWKEWMIQAFIIQESRRSGILITGSMEQGQRSKSAGGKAKVTGMTAGMPDMLIWLAGKAVLVELKVADGRVSDVQVEMHERLRELGHMVHVVFAKSPLDGWEQVKGIINGMV